MKSWQNSLRFSISQLNQNEGTTKLFNPSVVWQGSVVFGEVTFFSYFFFVVLLFVLLLLIKSLFTKTTHFLIVLLLFVIILTGSSKN